MRRSCLQRSRPLRYSTACGSSCVSSGGSNSSSSFRPGRGGAPTRSVGREPRRRRSTRGVPSPRGNRQSGRRGGLGARRRGTTRRRRRHHLRLRARGGDRAVARDRARSPVPVRPRGVSRAIRRSFALARAFAAARGRAAGADARGHSVGARSRDAATARAPTPAVPTELSDLHAQVRPAYALKELHTYEIDYPGLLATREALRGFGRRLLAEGMLDDVDDVWLLEREELRRALGESIDARALVAERRAELARGRLEGARAFLGAPPDERVRHAALEKFYGSAGRALTGTGASPGVVEGIARVVTGPIDLDPNPLERARAWRRRAARGSSPPAPAGSRARPARSGRADRAARPARATRRAPP